MHSRISAFAVLTTLALGALAPAPLRAVVISDFEPGGLYYGGIEGWFNYSGQDAFATYTDPVGGTGSWLGFKPTPYGGKITLQTWATPDLTGTTLAENTRFEFDLIPDAGWLPNSDNLALEIELNGTKFNFNQTVDTSAKNTSQHLVFDYSSIPAATSAAATSINISLDMNPGYDWGWDTNNPSAIPYAPKVYYDNFAVTSVAATPLPEPAAMTLALPALALLRRRR